MPLNCIFFVLDLIFILDYHSSKHIYNFKHSYLHSDDSAFIETNLLIILHLTLS